MNTENNLFYLYKAARQRSYEFREEKDCAVRALAIVTGEGYDMAHYALECQGRKRCDGTYPSQTLAALNELGYEYETIDAKDVPARTPVTLERLNLPGIYLVHFSTHIAAMIDGQILDWTQGRRHRILELNKVTKA